MKEDTLIYETESIKTALKKLDNTAEKVLLVIDNERRLQGTITDGDIRRHILKGKGLEANIQEIYNKNPISIKKDDFSVDLVKEILIKNKIELLPILDGGKKVIDFTTWTQVFSGNKIGTFKKSEINLPVIIMAGGKGERLGPFTKILPKPLIPLGEKPIIEIIIDKFNQNGVRHFYITLNYKGEMIKAYFNGLKKKYKMDYIWETEFSGTAGSLKLLPSNLEDTFIVSNCDIIVNADYADLLRFHQRSKNILTVVGSIQHYKMPYGIIHFEKEGKIKKIQEKPEFDFTVNTGMYVLSKKAIDFIPANKCFDMTDLLQALLDKKQNVGVYPVSEKSYIDIGQLEEFRKAIEKLELFG